MREGKYTQTFPRLTPFPRAKVWASLTAAVDLRIKDVGLYLKDALEASIVF